MPQDKKVVAKAATPKNKSKAKAKGKSKAKASAPDNADDHAVEEVGAKKKRPATAASSWEPQPKKARKK